jgi:Flp pilus assembly protein TadG
MKILFQKFLEDKSGAIFTELALSFPLFLGLSLTGVEFVSFMNTHMQVSQLTHMVADNVARVPIGITETDFIEIREQVRYNDVGRKLLNDNQGRIKISIVTTNVPPAPTVDPNPNDNIILDQRCYGSSEFTSKMSDEVKDTVLLNGIGPNGRKISAQNNNPVIFVETYFEYEPIFLSRRLFGDAISELQEKMSSVQYTTAASVRTRENQAIQSVPGVNPAACT